MKCKEFGRKLQEFGTKFLAAIAEHVETHQSPPSSSQPRKSHLSLTAQETLHLFRKGISIDQIAKERRFVASTIYGHLEQAIQAGEPVDISRLMTPDQHTQIAAAFGQTGFGNLTRAKELLGDLCDYAQLRLFRAIHGKTIPQ
jgi:uncharacterized protein YpbB